MIFDPGLARVMFKNHALPLNLDVVRWRLLINVFGADASHEQTYHSVRKHAQAILSKDGVVSELTAKVCTEIQSRTPDLVSFSKSIVDQNMWERPAKPFPTQQPHGLIFRPAVEVSFFALLNNFVGQAYSNALFGKEFTELFPSALEDLLILDDGWKYLAMGFPRWLPIRRLIKAHMARRALLNAMESFRKALDAHNMGQVPEPPWSDLRDTSALMMELNAFCRQHKTPPRIQTPAVLALVWGYVVD